MNEIGALSSGAVMLALMWPEFMVQFSASLDWTSTETSSKEVARCVKNESWFYRNSIGDI